MAIDDFKIEMKGVREYCEEMAVELAREDGVIVILAYNEGGHNSTSVDLRDLLGWLVANRPDLLPKGIE